MAEGHRKRLKTMLLKGGVDNVPHHNVLEAMLFYAIPRVDVNHLAHRLIDTFGSFANVIDAPHSELMKVEGIGWEVATLIKLFPEFSRLYQISKEQNVQIIDNVEKAGRFFLPMFAFKVVEEVHMLCLDGACRVIKCVKLGEGILNTTNISVKKVMENALNCNASKVMLAHNHPFSSALPSESDIATTHTIKTTLASVDVALVDHIIVCDNDYVSLADSGLLVM